MPPASRFPSCISVRYQSIPIPGWVPLFRYQTGSGISIFVHSGSGLSGCRTVRSSIYKRGAPCSSILLAVEMDTPCTSILLLVERNTPCRPVDSCWWCFILAIWYWKIVYKCQNTGMPEKTLSGGTGISSGNQLLQSGIGIPASGFSPVPLVTD